MKQCVRCNKLKNENEFGKSSKEKDGLRKQCKECRRLEYQKNKVKISYKAKEYRKKNIEKILAYQKEYYKNNKEKIKLMNKKYYKKNRDKAIKQKNEYEKNKMNSDPIFRLKKLLRKRVNNAFKNNYKSISTLELLGCTVDQAKNHIEKQFKLGMTWENHGIHGWHIDHIRPCASFDLSDPEQQKLCFLYTNLQPLWAKDNLSKSNKWGGEVHPNSPMAKRRAKLERS